MTNYNSTVMVWLRQTKDAERVRRIREQLAELTGVLAVTSSVRSPHLVLIKYDAQHTSSQQLLRVAHNQDQSARLLGM